MRPIYAGLPIAFARGAQYQGPRGLVVIDEAASADWHVRLHYAAAVRANAARHLGQTARTFNQLKVASDAANRAAATAKQHAESTGRHSCPRVQSTAARASAARQALEAKREEGKEAEEVYRLAKAQYRVERDALHFEELLTMLMEEDS